MANPFQLMTSAISLVVCGYVFYVSGGLSGDSQRKPYPAADEIFAIAPANKSAVKSALRSGVATCLEQASENPVAPIVKQVLGEALAELTDTESAAKGKMPNKLEVDAKFANYLLKFAKQNEQKLSRMSKEEISEMENGFGQFKDAAVKIFQCSFDNAKDQLVKAGKIKTTESPT